MMKRRDFGKQIAAAGLTSAVLGTHRVLADDRQIHVGMLLYPQTTASTRIHVQLNGYQFAACTINLAQPWQGIHHDLLELIRPE